MKAVVMQDATLQVHSLADPEPGPGEALVKTLACGICGSDLHMLHNCELVLEGFQYGGIPMNFNPAGGIVFGHEYCAEIMDYGAGAERKLKPGTRVCSIPYILSDKGFEHVGYSNHYPGGFGEKMILPENLLIPVPGDLPSDLAALTEPLAVGTHAVSRANLAGDEIPIVIGCGPIGLAVIIALKAKGSGPIVAADFSAKRRDLAEKLGADIVVDPATDSPYQSWIDVAAPEHYDPQSAYAMFGVGPQPKPCVVFECVGIPGMIQQIMSKAPPHLTRLVVVGVCMQTDSIEPIICLAKESNLHYSFGYTMEEFSSTLHGLADGRIVADALITSTVDQEGVAEAFEMLGNPENQVKVMISFEN